MISDTQHAETLRFIESAPKTTSRDPEEVYEQARAFLQSELPKK